MGRGAPDEIEELRREVDRSLRDRVETQRILPLLARLARVATPASEAWLFAHRHLAELGVEHDPWRAALFARRVLTHRRDDDGAWAVLGLAQSLLGHYRFAAKAYERALALAPNNPFYAHNLGHLVDVALGKPNAAITLLARAFAIAPEEADIAASYAHALARAGDLATARRVLAPVVQRNATAEHVALFRWIEAGAPEVVAKPKRKPRKKARRRSDEPT
jgi:Flp pilus assembly protein TadD